MSDSIIVLEPLPAAGVKQCQPNLMPFHVSYNGPALISMFMNIKPAKQEPGTPAQQAIPTPETSTTQPEDAENLKEEFMSIDKAADSDPAGEASPGEPEFSTTRSVSSFRGRIIQGLKVDLPQGYRGLVLQAPPVHTTTSASVPSTSKAASATKSQAQQEDVLGDDDAPPPTTRRRGRLTRSAVSKRVNNVEKEEAKKIKEVTIDVDAEVKPAMDVDASAPGTDAPILDADTTSPQRRLKAIAEFSSFTLWHADNPVVEGQDEYYRSLYEWTSLAASLHHGDDEENPS
ncbi:ribonuclease H2, subunit C [Ephemerocybe angulata]|uniref:Ribonuclease H2, subunit C n=1 Tax=Ephemerocybe angulata TaxID=980116 RepID=A0A8H6HXB5_9AGAR|nr:ribonuclease H2, subunit C [Tulosesus angulatus]